MYGLPNLVAVQRFTSLPIVKSSIDKATHIYVKVKKSNRLVQWSLHTAEVTVTIAIDLSTPTIILFDGPIHLIDEILCKSLDMVEDAVPIIKQEPDQIFQEAKNYVTSALEPVLKRADSVKEISIQGANKAAQSIDSVLTAADGIVDKYLPELQLEGGLNPGSDVVDSRSSTLYSYGLSVVEEPPRNATVKTIRHVGKFSSTLRRRLTQRTIYEARALKKQGMNIIQVLVQLTDLLARDPKAFVRQMKDLWLSLSEEEPENQAPPQNLEELIVLLTREGARRFVHVANFVSTNFVRIPEYARAFIHLAISKYAEYVQSLHLTSTGVKREAEILKHALNDIFDQFMILIKPLLSSSTGGEVKLSITKVIKNSLTNESQANGGATVSAT